MALGIGTEGIETASLVLSVLLVLMPRLHGRKGGSSLTGLQRNGGGKDKLWKVIGTGRADGEYMSDMGQRQAEGTHAKGRGGRHGGQG